MNLIKNWVYRLIFGLVAVAVICVVSLYWRADGFSFDSRLDWALLYGWPLVIRAMEGCDIPAIRVSRYSSISMFFAMTLGCLERAGGQ